MNGVIPSWYNLFLLFKFQRKQSLYAARWIWRDPCILRPKRYQLRIMWRRGLDTSHENWRKKGANNYNHQRHSQDHGKVFYHFKSHLLEFGEHGTRSQSITAPMFTAVSHSLPRSTTSTVLFFSYIKRAITLKNSTRPFFLLYKTCHHFKKFHKKELCIRILEPHACFFGTSSYKYFTLMTFSCSNPFDIFLSLSIF